MSLLVPIATHLALGAVLAAMFVRYRTTPARDALKDPGDALRHFRLTFPQTRGRATLTADGGAALVELDGRRAVGILARRGGRWSARLLEPGDLRRVAATGDAGLRLMFRDAGWSPVTLSLADATHRAHWLGRLAPLAVMTEVAPSPGAGYRA